MCAKFHFVMNLFRAIMTVDLTIELESHKTLCKNEDD